MSIQRLTFLKDGYVQQLNYNGQPAIALFEDEFDENFIIAIEVNLVGNGMFPVYIAHNCAGNRIHNIGWDYSVFRTT